MVTQLTSSTFDKEVLSAKGPVLVDFFANWCKPCQMMAPVFEETSKDFKGKIKFAKVDVDEEEELAQQNNIQNLPCLVIFNKGKEVTRFIGYMDKEKLTSKIQSVMPL